jgi:hypothetical protein
MPDKGGFIPTDVSVDGQTTTLICVDVARLLAYTCYHARVFVPHRMYASSCQRRVRRCYGVAMCALQPRDPMDRGVYHGGQRRCNAA